MGRKTVVGLGISITVLFASLLISIVYYTETIKGLQDQIVELHSQVAQLEGEKANLQNQVQNLQEENAALLDEISVKNVQIEKLHTQVGILNSQISNLQNQIALKEQQISSLESQVNSLITEKNILQMWLENNITFFEEQMSILNYQKLTLENTVENLTQEYNDLLYSYQCLQSEHYNYVMAYENLVEKVNWRWNQINVERFITPDDPAVKNLVFNITGGWSNPSDLNELLTDLKTMYNWVVNNIEYRYDGLYPILPYDPHETISFWDEMWQLPNETLELRKGDCEDMAILLCSMIRAYGNEQYFTEAIFIVGEDVGHIAVQIPSSENRIIILDPAGNYYTSDLSGNLTSKDIEEEINDWLNYWKPQLGSNVYVYRVFSDYIDETFNSTEEYLDWMKADRVEMGPIPFSKS